MQAIDMRTLKLVNIAPKKRRLWYYKFEGEKERPIIKDGRWWYYNVEGFGDTGCDTLGGAKGDLLSMGAKVYSRLV